MSRTIKNTLLPVPLGELPGAISKHSGITGCRNGALSSNVNLDIIKWKSSSWSVALCMKQQLNKFIRLVKMLVVGRTDGGWMAAERRRGVECRLGLMRKIGLNAYLTLVHFGDRNQLPGAGKFPFLFRPQ